jgi:hypothetical protein
MVAPDDAEKARGTSPASYLRPEPLVFTLLDGFHNYPPPESFISP